MFEDIIEKANIRQPGEKGERVVVGMSGGADSSAAAFLLREAGYEVLGLTLGLFDDTASGSRSKSSPAVRAARICDILGIEHETFDVAGLFDERVRRTFVDAYRDGLTPNPCIRCNETVKFPAIASFASSRGIDRIATGHYASLARVGGKNLVSAAADAGKDQTYFLYRVPVSILNRVIFPLGKLKKDEVKEMAASLGIDIYTGGESQDICFIPDGDTQGFLERFIDPRPGEVVDGAGRVLGKHGGIHRYTLGQRKGLGISTGSPAYVTRLEPATSRVVLSGKKDLFSKTVTCFKLKMRMRDPGLPLTARIRYRHPPAEITGIDVSGGRCKVTFAEEQRAATPGQSLVIYSGNTVIGGGIIMEEGIV